MKKIRFGALGYGAIGRVYGRIIQNPPCAALIAMPNADVRGVSAPHCECCNGCQALLQNAEIDAAAFCLSLGMHKKAACGAAKPHKHALCEKPIDVERARAQKMGWMLAKKTASHSERRAAPL